MIYFLGQCFGGCLHISLTLCHILSLGHSIPNSAATMQAAAVVARVCSGHLNARAFLFDLPGASGIVVAYETHQSPHPTLSVKNASS